MLDLRCLEDPAPLVAQLVRLRDVSAQRLIVAVLEAHGREMTPAEVVERAGREPFTPDGLLVVRRWLDGK